MKVCAWVMEVQAFYYLKVEGQPKQEVIPLKEKLVIFTHLNSFRSLVFNQIIEIGDF